MKLKVLTTCDNQQHEGYLKLKVSLEKFGYDFECIDHKFEFGHQLPVIQKWCEDYIGNCTHILYTDAFDTIAFANQHEVIQKFITVFEGFKMLISGEKNCYPHPERASDYPYSDSPFRFVNGGGWLVEIEYFKELCKKENLNSDSHDQVWLMDAYLKNQSDIMVDTHCEIFQTIAFSNIEEWQKEGERFRNIKENSLPIFYHGNGRTNMSWLYQ